MVYFDGHQSASGAYLPNETASSDVYEANSCFSEKQHVAQHIKSFVATKPQDAPMQKLSMSMLG